MTQVDKSLAERVLSLVCPPGVGLPSDIASITEAEWSRILGWGVEHRIAPLIYYTVRNADLLSELPGGVRNELSGLYRNATLHALIVQRDLIRVHDTLNAAGIPHLFLKGAFLAQFAYPELGLRPLRDIDVIVPQSEALAAYSRLRGMGFQPFNGGGGYPEAFLRDSKHLPALQAPDGSTAVEVHTSLVSHGQESLGVTMPDFGGLSSRSVSRIVAGEVIEFPSAEDLLLHLCVHSVYEHQFSNGPLVISDLHWLIGTQVIDWPRVWREAALQGSVRGLTLMLALVGAQGAGTAVKWPEAPQPSDGVNSEVLACTTALLFRDFSARNDVVLMEQIGRSGTACGAVDEIMRRMFPSRMEVARQFPVPPASPLIFACYPARWIRLLLWRLPSLLTTLFVGDRRAERRDLRRLRAWLLKRARAP